MTTLLHPSAVAREREEFLRRFPETKDPNGARVFFAELIKDGAEKYGLSEREVMNAPLSHLTALRDAIDSHKLRDRVSAMEQEKRRQAEQAEAAERKRAADKKAAEQANQLRRHNEQNKEKMKGR